MRRLVPEQVGQKDDVEACRSGPECRVRGVSDRPSCSTVESLLKQRRDVLTPRVAYNLRARLQIRRQRALDGALGILQGITIVKVRYYGL